jgi:ABC-type multidrug transport system permease subunit
MNTPFLRRLGSVMWARTLEFLRDWSALGWNLLLPLVLVLGLAFLFSGPEKPLFKVAVVSSKPTTPAGSHPFLGTKYIEFFDVSDRDASIRKVERHQIDMLLDLRAGQHRYWVNATSPKGYILEQLITGDDRHPIRREAVQGREIRYVDWLLPGILGMNMMFSCLFGVGYVIVRYRKSGYLKRLYATPLRAIEFISAQVLSRLVLIMLITVAIFIGTNFFVHFRMEGSYFNLFLVTLLGAASMVAMGLVVSARVTGEELAGGLLNMLSWPMMFLSGVWFSLEGAHASLQSIAQLFPLTHLLDAARAIMLDGAGLGEITHHLLVLGGMTALFLAFGAGVFKWTQD